MSSAQESTVEVDLQTIAFGSVGGRTSADIERDTRLAERLPSVFEEYVAEIVDKQDIVDVEHGIFDRDSEVEDKIQVVLNSDDDDDYLEASIELVRRLNDQMTGSAAAGTLFIIKSQISGPELPEGKTDIVALLKLDNMIDRRGFIDDDDLGEIDEEDAFPRSGQIQKGALYPAHDLPPREQKGDVKIYQRSESDYFRYFFDCKTRIPSSLEQSRKVQTAFSSILEDTIDRSITSEDMSQIVTEADEEDGEVTRETIESSLETITDGRVESETIEEVFGEESLRELQINVDDFPTFSKAIVNTPDGEITVKFPMSASDWVDVDETEESVQVRVDGKTVKWDFVDR